MIGIISLSHLDREIKGMKQKFVIVIILIYIALFLSACEIQQNSNSNTDNNAIQKPSGKEVTSQSPSTEAAEKSTTMEKSSQPVPIKTTEISIEELTQFLNSKRSKIIKAVGNHTENGTVSIMESHMIFPFTFVKNLGLTFVFPNETDDFSPTYIIIDKETNIKDFNIKGAKPGMDFRKIMGKLGKSHIVKTWFANEDNVAYKLDYVMDKVVYSFVSYDKQGKESQLYITLKDK
jgi:hypothetical protein